MDNAIVVTGGAGFIGSNFILQWIAQEGTPVAPGLSDLISSCNGLRRKERPYLISIN